MDRPDYQTDRAGLGYRTQWERTLFTPESAETNTVDPETDPTGWAALTARNTAANTTGQHIVEALGSGNIDERVSIMWANDADDIRFAEESRGWARHLTRQRQTDRRADRAAIHAQQQHQQPSQQKGTTGPKTAMSGTKKATSRHSAASRLRRHQRKVAARQQNRQNLPSGEEHRESK